ncbi:MAG TPA: sugar ABC transporter permease [Roseiflexaceae bacterium]|nr:sugar ABC transporter permease [Roseiflexaceae bacterium]
MIAQQQAVHQRKRSSLRRRSILQGYLFIAPVVLGYLIWVAGPMLMAIWLSLTEWNLLQPPKYVGLSNYQLMFQDELFWKSLSVTLYFTLVSVPLSLAISFAVALLMNVKVRGIAVFRTLFYLPSIVPAVASAVLWVWVLNSEFGLLNFLLRTLGLPKVLWLQDPHTAMPSLILMSLWGIGGTMVIYLAGLQGIPQHLYEAAEIDGANYWNRFRHVTIPMMSPVIFFNLVIGLIAALQTFTQGYLITRGGPQNSTLFYGLYIYRSAFQDYKMGYAAALSWVLFTLVLLLSLFVFRHLGRLVYYEESR